MRWKHAENIMVTEVPDPAGSTAVVLHLGTRHYFTLNASGLFIFRQMEGGSDDAAIAKTLCEHYELSPERANAAIQRLATELLRDKLIETA